MMQAAGSLFVVIIYAVIMLVSFAISIATYVLTAIAYMKIGKKGGLKNGALAFFPFTSQYYAGKIAEKDCEINGKEVKPWGKTYLGLGIVSAALGLVEGLLGFIFALLGGSGAFGAFEYPSASSVTDFVAAIPDSLFTIFAIMVAIILVEIVLAIILQVVGYIVLYKVYHLVAPESAGWLLVLSIFVGGASFIILLILGFGKKFRAHSVAVSDGTIVEE